jgi:hypothetical protein
LAHLVINLDESGVTADPIDVILHGETYRLPGDLPAPLYVKLLALRERAQTASAGEAEGATQELNLQLHDELLALFRLHQPDLERLPLGVNEMVLAVGYIYSPAARERAEGKAKPAAKPRSRSTRTPASRKRSTGSRSST